MRKWMAVAAVAVLATVGAVVLAQSGDDEPTPTPAPPTTVAPTPPSTTIPVPYDPETGVVGTIPPVDPNVGEGILSSGGT